MAALTVQTERTTGGEWVAEVMELPGCIVVAKTEDEALSKVAALALRVLADRLEHGEAKPETVSFVMHAAA